MESEPTEVSLRGRDLLARCVAGDPDSRSEFVGQYTGLIRFAIVSVLRQRGLAVLKDEVDDLAQGIILSLLDRDCRKLKLYDGRNQASFATFIRVCATRYVLDHIRHERRRPTISSDDRANAEAYCRYAEAADPHAGPDTRLETNQRLERLRAVTTELPAREQLFIRLHFIEQLEVPEVARVLGLSENASYVLKSRLRKKLRGLVDEVDRG